MELEWKHDRRKRLDRKRVLEDRKRPPVTRGDGRALGPVLGAQIDAPKGLTAPYAGDPLRPRIPSRPVSIGIGEPAVVYI